MKARDCWELLIWIVSLFEKKFSYLGSPATQHQRLLGCKSFKKAFTTVSLGPGNIFCMDVFKCRHLLFVLHRLCLHLNGREVTLCYFCKQHTYGNETVNVIRQSHNDNFPHRHPCTVYSRELLHCQKIICLDFNLLQYTLFSKEFSKACSPF
jgi:hypothetical protein